MPSRRFLLTRRSVKVVNRRRKLPEAVSTRFRVRRAGNYTVQEVTSSGRHRDVSLGHSFPGEIGAQADSERTTRSAQTRPPLPGSVGLWQVRDPSGTRPMSRGQPGTSHSRIKKAKSNTARKRNSVGRDSLFGVSADACKALHRTWHPFLSPTFAAVDFRGKSRYPSTADEGVRKRSGLGGRVRGQLCSSPVGIVHQLHHTDSFVRGQDIWRHSVIYDGQGQWSVTGI